ncbi:helix-turn-helix transcriptional regulator [Paenibacillus sp. GSMTC-2017]|uniref:helix-turn-helix transcriptional regulator n=1 Tax=Paenibacillus sp. GSMTC-2017 TaxID=2794350 RepID=UPI0018D8A0B5|nr:helix-turn-helix transcriptional regulator [Paenibacillus sp. GSMTC-2017]MBH5317313.1 helix-turn-helix transcriptional regulator [Paenibacillus sp. GSMTC-2017]
MIGERIKSLREKKGYSITKLADLAGVSKSYLSYIERNVQNNPSLQVLAKIAFHLDTNIEFLLGEDLSPKVWVDEVLDEEWHSIIRDAVDEGMSKGDFRALKDLVRSNKWKEEQGKSREYAGIDSRKKSNIIILHIDH